MKKVVLLHSENVLNYGTMMMVTNFISYSGRDRKYFLDVKNREDLQRVEKSLEGSFDLERLSLSPKPSIKNVLDNIKNVYIKNFVHTKEILKINPDTVVVLGGDDLSEYYAGWKIAIELLKLKKLSKRTKIILVGQTMGPFYSWRKILAKYCLKDIKILFRDMESFNYVKEEIGLNSNLFKSEDLAFMKLPKEGKNQDVLKKYGLKENEYVTVVPSGLHKQYCNDLNCYLREWVSIIANLSDNEKLKNKKIVLLAHVLSPHHVDDRVAIEKIEKLLDKDLLKKVIVINDIMQPVDAREILGNGKLTITGRMHPAISTFEKGKPAISLSYSIKYEGVIGSNLKRGDLIIESKDENLWCTNQISKEVTKKVNYVLSNYENLISSIKKEIKDISERLNRQIKELI